MVLYLALECVEGVLALGVFDIGLNTALLSDKAGDITRSAAVTTGCSTFPVLDSKSVACSPINKKIHTQNSRDGNRPQNIQESLFSVCPQSSIH